MEFYALLPVFPLLFLQSSAQLPPYQAVPENCGKICFPSDGYATWFGATLCACRSELCDFKYCARPKRCRVKQLWYGDAAVCERAPETQPFPNPLTANNPALSAAETCRQPPVTGDCRAFIPRFYFHPDSNTCKRFVFGGCGGNGNNFENLQACLTKCQPSNINGGGNRFGNNDLLSSLFGSLSVRRAGT